MWHQPGVVSVNAHVRRRHEQGLGAAHCHTRCREPHDIDVYEANDYPSGTSTPCGVDTEDATHLVNTGFIVLGEGVMQPVDADSASWPSAWGPPRAIP
jgi:hypothetical protein